MRGALIDLGFRKYIGQTIKIVMAGVEPYTYEQVDVKDLVYLQIMSEASQSGLTVKFYLPRVRQALDIKSNKINVYLSSVGLIEKLYIG